MGITTRFEVGDETKLSAGITIWFLCGEGVTYDHFFDFYCPRTLLPPVGLGVNLRCPARDSWKRGRKGSG
jgi:hypothetical protein